jgi:hypothetical protein
MAAIPRVLGPTGAALGATVLTDGSLCKGLRPATVGP